MHIAYLSHLSESDIISDIEGCIRPSKITMNYLTQESESKILVILTISVYYYPKESRKL